MTRSACSVIIEARSKAMNDNSEKHKNSWGTYAIIAGIYLHDGQWMKRGSGISSIQWQLNCGSRSTGSLILLRLEEERWIKFFLADLLDYSDSIKKHPKFAESYLMKLGIVFSLIILTKPGKKFATERQTNLLRKTNNSGFCIRQAKKFKLGSWCF